MPQSNAAFDAAAMFAPFDTPSVDTTVAAQSRNLEAVFAANKIAADGFKALAQRHSEIARGAVDDGEPGALQRFARFEVVADAASAALRRIRPALESLYRTLDEAQRKAFDELLSRGTPHPYGARY